MLRFIAVIIVLISVSGCQVANTMFQIDSDSSVPQFGVNLIPSKGWFGQRGISYHKRKIEYHGKQQTGSLQVIDLEPPKSKVQMREVSTYNSSSETDNHQTPDSNNIKRIPVNVVLPKVCQQEEFTRTTENLELFD